MDPESQDRICPVRTAIHVARQGMVSGEMETRLEKVIGGGRKEREERHSTRGCMFIKEFTLYS